MELVYEAKPSPQVPEITPQAVDDAIDTIRKRTDALGVSEPEIQSSGGNQITVSLPAVENAQRAEEQVGTTAKLQFYDWEPNRIVEDNGRVTDLFTASIENPDPNTRNRLNRPLPLLTAVELGAKAKPKAEPEDVPPGEDISPGGGRQEERHLAERPLLPVRPGHRRLGQAAGRPRARPATTCSPTTSPSPAPPSSRASRPRARSARRSSRSSAPRGRPRAATSSRCRAASWWFRASGPRTCRRTRPSTSGTCSRTTRSSPARDIKNPEQNFDQRTNEPIVTFEFTDKGRKAFARVTKRIAQRGFENQAFLGRGDSAVQTFAITLDNKLVSNATVDFRDNPEGIDGRTGAQINGIGTLQETQDLAKNLRIGALPVDLKLVSKTQVSSTLGEQALRQGLYAGRAGLALTILFLLVFYRVLGVIAASR